LQFSRWQYRAGFPKIPQNLRRQHRRVGRNKLLADSVFWKAWLWNSEAFGVDRAIASAQA